MTEDEILKIHANVFYGALRSQNYAALEELYSDDYRLVRPDGSVAEQAGSAARPAENGLTFHSIDLLQRMVRILRLHVDRWNVRDISPQSLRQNIGFTLEPDHAFGIFGEGFGQDFQRHIAPQPCVAGQVDLAHSAGAQRRSNFIRA